jgi:hypothetical protein
MTATFIPAFSQTAGVNVYLQTNLVGNVKGLAPVVDPNLVDPWGLSISASSPFWVSNHLSGTSTLYNGAGTITPTVVKIPAGAASAAGALGRPARYRFSCLRRTEKLRRLSSIQTTEP